MGLTSLLFARAGRAALDGARAALDADRALQVAMAALIEARAEAHRRTPAPRWRRGEPLSLLLAGYVGSRNTGADVRVEEMIRQLRHLLGDDHVDLSILTIDPAWTRGYFRTVKQIEVPQVFPKFLFDEVARHDGVVACEGSMFKSKFASALTTMMVGALGLARAEDKVAVGYGGEAGHMDESLEAMVRRYVAGSLVLTRNPESSAVLERLGIATRVGTDTAWTYDDPPPERAERLLRGAGWDGASPVLVLCPIHPFWWPVRPDPWKAAAHRLTGAFERSHFRSIYFHAEGKDVERKLERYLSAMVGAALAFRAGRPCFPVVVGMEALDRTAAERFAALWKERTHGERVPLFVADEHEHPEVVGLLRRATWLVSSRYHAIVCSMPAGVPSVGITMDERIANLMNDRGQASLCLGVEDDALEERLLHAMRTMAADADALRAGTERAVAAHLVRMGEMGRAFVDHVRAAHPRFPLRPGLGDGGEALAHLPPLGARQRGILERMT